MAPSGLTITKLAVQITADDELSHTLLCLKISLPRDIDTRPGGQWNLFNHGAPRLSAEPQILPLPLSPWVINQSDQIGTAALLLSLSPETTRADYTRTECPAVHVTSTGQIAVVLESSTPRKRREMGPIVANSPGGGLGRKEFVVVLEFQQSVEDARGWHMLAVPLPKCLDNVLRFQVLPPRASSSTTGEVSIVTEPKILPIPSSTFSPRVKSAPASNGKVIEDGWEDGESLGPEDLDSESEDGGNWLEGRFQSTESLRLEWSFATSSPQIPSLHVTPNWDGFPSIHMEYEAFLGETRQVEAALPDGWGWSELRMEGEGLQSWYCTDGEWWDPLLSSSLPPDPDVSDITDRPDEDSFATVRARRNLPPASRTLPSLSRSSSGASLMRQPLPQPDPSFDEFSFELNSMPAATTPLRKGSVLAQSLDKPSLPGVALSRPAPGRSFGLVGNIASVRITGKLVPLSKTLLVSPSAPVITPVFRIDGNSQCHLSPDATIIDVYQPPMMMVDRGHVPHPPVSGDIAISIKRSHGTSRMTVSFPWPKRAAEVDVKLVEEAEIVSVEMRGRTLPRVVVGESEGSVLVIGKGEGVEGVCTVILEMDEEEWGLPVFESATGRMTVELLGKRWNTANMHTTLTRQSPTSYSIALPPKSPIVFKTSETLHTSVTQTKTSHLRGVWSWSTLIIIFMLYLLLSMAQQIQRLRSEVAFISEESRDLRMYSSKLEERVSLVEPYLERVGRDMEVAGDTVCRGGGGRGDLDWERNQHWDQHSETTPGRVVLGRTGWNWESWVRHPTVTSLSKSLGWLWHTVVWLVHA